MSRIVQLSPKFIKRAGEYGMVAEELAARLLERFIKTEDEDITITRKPKK